MTSKLGIKGGRRHVRSSMVWQIVRMVTGLANPGLLPSPSLEYLLASCPVLGVLAEGRQLAKAAGSNSQESLLGFGI